MKPQKKTLLALLIVVLLVATQAFSQTGRPLSIPDDQIEQETGEQIEQETGKALFYSCTGWGNRWVSSGGSFTFYFSPGIKGTHKIVFGNGDNVLSAGTLSFYWRNTPAGVTTWKYFDTLSVERNPVQQRTLYSGSRDIEYRFIYRATSSANFGWRLCTG